MPNRLQVLMMVNGKATFARVPAKQRLLERRADHRVHRPRPAPRPLLHLPSLVHDFSFFRLLSPNFLPCNIFGVLYASIVSRLLS